MNTTTIRYMIVDNKTGHRKYIEKTVEVPILKTIAQQTAFGRELRENVQKEQSTKGASVTAYPVSPFIEIPNF